MRTKIIFICVVITLSALLAACGAGGGNTTTPNTNTATANTNSTNPLNTNTAPPEEVSNNAPTLTPIFKAYCEAWVKNDEAALRKVYSADTIKQFEGEMKEEKTKSLLKLLSADKVSGTPCEVRNEKITGDTATATIVSNKMPNGVKVVFVKENGEWKLTTKSPTIDAVTKAQPAANTAK
jgi:hypothetical protein